MLNYAVFRRYVQNGKLYYVNETRGFPFLAARFGHEKLSICSQAPRALLLARASALALCISGQLGRDCFVDTSRSAEMVPLVSMAGYISLLGEPETELQNEALVNLNKLVDQFWMEIAEHGSLM